jgi:hypothetical protein
MGVLDAIDHLRQLGLHLGQRQRLRHDHDSSHVDVTIDQQWQIDAAPLTVLGLD